MAANVAAGKPKPFDCSACRWGRYCDDRNPAPFAQWVIPGVIESRTCLLPMVTPLSRQFIRLYRQYRRNIMPNAGGWDDQYHLYKQAMEVLDPMFIELERPEPPPSF